MITNVTEEIKLQEERPDDLGPLEVAYLTVPFREISMAESLSCAFAGLAVDRPFRLSTNAYKLPEMDPTKTKYVHVGGFYDGKSDPKPGEYFNGGVYDSDRLLFDEDGRPREIDLRKLSENGTGLTQAANTVVLHVPFEIDDDADGNPIPLVEQCRFIDRNMIAKWGFPVPNVVTLSGDDREWATDDKYAHIGKSVHCGFAVLPSTDFELREKVTHAIAVITGGDPAVADRCRRMRLGGCKTRWAGWMDCGLWRYQTALLMRREPTTLEHLWGCCQRAAADLGIADTEKAYQARLVAKALSETSHQCLELARELWGAYVGVHHG